MKNGKTEELCRKKIVKKLPGGRMTGQKEACPISARCAGSPLPAGNIYFGVAVCIKSRRKTFRRLKIKISFLQSITAGTWQLPPSSWREP